MLFITSKKKQFIWEEKLSMVYYSPRMYEGELIRQPRRGGDVKLLSSMYSATFKSPKPSSEEDSIRGLVLLLVILDILKILFIYIFNYIIKASFIQLIFLSKYVKTLLLWVLKGSRNIMMFIVCEGKNSDSFDWHIEQNLLSVPH